MEEGLRASQAGTLMTVDFDVSTASVSEGGLEGFRWPVGADEISTFRDALVRQLLPILQSGPEMAPLLLASNHLLRHLMAIKQGLVLARYLRKEGLQAHIPANAHMWRALIAGIEPPMPAFLKDLELSVHGRVSTLYNLGLGPLADVVLQLRRPKGLYNGRIERHPYSARLASQHIIAVSPSMMVARHAEVISEKVYFARFGEWFRPLNGRTFRSDPEITQVVPTISEVFRDFDTRLEPALETHVAMCVKRAHGVVSAHLCRLASKPELLPRRLWTGTGGNIWSRMLRHAVREVGGHVTGHDHATGSGYKTSTRVCLVELIACDRFIAANQARVDALQISSRDPILVTLPVPEIVALPSSQGSGKSFSPAARYTDHECKRAMYVSTIYPGDSMHMDPHTPDVVMADWQARLLAHLRKWGWNVLHKPHPESATPPPTVFSDLFAARVIDGRFEDVMSEANVFVFDKVNTTTFGLALSRGLPIVYVEIDDWPWLPEAWEALCNRVAVVRANRDREGRIAVDWNELEAALMRAPGLVKNRQFYEKYVA